MLKFQFSDYARKSLVPSAVNEMTLSFAEDFREGIDINLGVGYVNDRTIPSVPVYNALHEVLAKPEQYRNALNYGSAEGSPNLRAAIRSYYVRNAVGGFAEADFADKAIVIGANGATSLLESLAHIFKPGVVITAEPCYYIYAEFLHRCGFTVIGVPEEHDGIDTAALAKALRSVPAEKLRFLYIITVNNPTGTILSNAKRAEILRLANEASEAADARIPVIFDRAYEDIIYRHSGETPRSALLMEHGSHAIEIGTLSKVLAPALRIGYLIARKSTLTQTLIQRVSDIGFSAPLITQEIASVLLSRHLDEQLENVCRGYRHKAEFLRQLFGEHLAPYVESVRGGEAGFYYYIQFTEIETGKDSSFFRYLARTTGKAEIDGAPVRNPRLIYIPGEICTLPGSVIAGEAARSLRISFGFEETAVLERAVILIKEACEFSLGPK